ncbi:MAG: hypothetical protein ACOYXT_09310 [Bacteroidota bacterium]
MKTGLLFDYGMHFTNIEKYDGVRSDSNYLSYDECKLLYASVYSCKFNDKALMLPPAVAFKRIEAAAIEEKNSTIEEDFGDGEEWRIILPNIPAHAAYDTEGIKALALKVMFTDGSAKEGHGRITVSGIARKPGAALSRKNQAYQFPVAEFQNSTT